MSEPDPEPPVEVIEEGCPDCGADTVVLDGDDEDSVRCTGCGWRP